LRVYFNGVYQSEYNTSIKSAHVNYDMHCGDETILVTFRMVGYVTYSCTDYEGNPLPDLTCTYDEDLSGWSVTMEAPENDGYSCVCRDPYGTVVACCDGQAPPPPPPW